MFVRNSAVSVSSFKLASEKEWFVTQYWILLGIIGALWGTPSANWTGPNEPNIWGYVLPPEVDAMCEMSP